MFGVLKGFECSSYKFNDGKEIKVLNLYVECCNFAKNDSRLVSDGVPVMSLQFKGDIDSVIPSLSVGSKYDFLIYFDSGNKRRFCNGLTSVPVSNK